MSTEAAQIFKTAVGLATEVLHSTLQLEKPILGASELMIDCLTRGNKVLVCGNGGSAADAADFTTEFACKFVADRRPYPALNLGQGGSLLTAIGNDYGFEEIFARQVAAFGNKDDVLVAISTSGRSPNIRRGLTEARARGLKTIALLGRDGGSSSGFADLDIIVPAQSTARIQEAHKFILHVICELCETHLARSEHLVIAG